MLIVSQADLDELGRKTADDVTQFGRILNAICESTTAEQYISLFKNTLQYLI